MKILRVLSLALGLSVLPFGVLAKELPPDSPETKKDAEKVFKNPPTLSFHTDSTSLGFLLGTWFYKGENESIEETWLKSSLNEVTCIRITRKILTAETPLLRLTIPTNRDPSLPEITSAEAPSKPIKSAVQEEEIYSIQDTERGSRVSLLKLDNSRWSVQDCWVGSLDQQKIDSVSIKLINLSKADSKLVFTYKQISPKKIVCTRADAENSKEFNFVKIR